MMSPTLHCNVSQILDNVSIETSSPLDNLAIVADDAPIARRSSVLFMSLSINSFQSFLYDTFTATLTFAFGCVLYHILLVLCKGKILGAKLNIYLFFGILLIQSPEARVARPRGEA